MPRQYQSSSRDSPEPSSKYSPAKSVIMHPMQRLPGETSHQRSERVVHQIKVALAKQADLLE